MINRLTRLGGALLVAGALSSTPMLATGIQQEAPEMMPMTGIWALNVDASENPSGAEKPSTCANAGRGGGRAGGGGGRGGGGTGVIGGGSDTGGSVMFGGGGGNAELGPVETARLCDTLSYFYEAPAVMGLQVTQEMFLQVLDPETMSGYKHEINDESTEGATPAGSVEFKVKWDDAKVVREISNIDSLKITEEYSMSADGTQLIVTLKATSRMVRVPDPKVRRVYDRRQ